MNDSTVSERYAASWSEVIAETVETSERNALRDASTYSDDFDFIGYA